MKHTDIYSCLILAHKPEKLEQIASHLRYWPYVKYYYFLDERSIIMAVKLGKAKKHKERLALYERTRKLVKLCLKQYDIEVSHWVHEKPFFVPVYSDDLFVRPSKTLKSFQSFIEELDVTSNSVTNF